MNILNYIVKMLEISLGSSYLQRLVTEIDQTDRGYADEG